MHTEGKHVLPWCWVLMRALPRAVSLTKSLPLWLMSGRRKTRSKTKSDGDKSYEERDAERDRRWVVVVQFKLANLVGNILPSILFSTEEVGSFMSWLSWRVL